MSFKSWRGIKNDYYFANAGTLKPREGAMEAWKEIVRAGMKTAFVSNAERLIVEANIRALGLDRDGFLSVNCDDVDRAKPHPDPYLFAAQQFRVEPSNAAVIEDSSEGAAAGVAARAPGSGWLAPTTGKAPPPP